MGESRNGKPKTALCAALHPVIEQPGKPRRNAATTCDFVVLSSVSQKRYGKCARNRLSPMSEPLPPHPLHRFPLVDTSDPNEVRNLLFDVFGARYFDVRQDSRPFHVAWNYARLKEIDLGYAHYNSAVSVGIAGIDMVRQMFSLTGSSRTAFGSRQFTSDREHSSLIPAGVEARVDRAAGHGELRLRIDATALRVKLGAMIGTPIARNVEFAAPDSRPQLLRLPRLAIFLAGQLDCEAAKIPDQVLAEYEQLVMV